MTTNQTHIFENNALRCLGGLSKRNRTDLRQLPHVVIDRGRRMAPARIYKTADVLALRKAHFSRWKAEIEQIKQSFNEACQCPKTWQGKLHGSP